MAALVDNPSVLPETDFAAAFSKTNNMEEPDYVEGEDQSGEHSEDSDSSSEEEPVDDAVKEDMLKLEESFEEHGMKFRLIDRNGDGEHMLCPCVWRFC